MWARPPVPGLAAKPIIDIDVYVKAIEPMRPCRDPLERLGYLFVFDPEFLSLHFFGYPEKRPRRFWTRHNRRPRRDAPGRSRAPPDAGIRIGFRPPPRARERTLTAAPLDDRDAYI